MDKGSFFCYIVSVGNSPGLERKKTMIYTLTPSETISKIHAIGNKIKSGDDIHIVNSKGQTIGKIQIDYIRRERLWYVKPFVGKSEKDFEEPRTNDEREKHVPSTACLKIDLKQEIYRQSEEIKVGVWK